ncbi:hypothetical protein [Endozoicomonas ascidiicola]|uniref:hypothetical protein n=1 Tax=Endozoicomonas ascidiicola TaxID=1698521 RepID=UPI000A96FE7D|nr:hypothetical protein [Endozoicomonas ascidiicola]
MDRQQHRQQNRQRHSKSDDLLGFRCHFYPASICTGRQIPAKCRPAFAADRPLCPDSGQCNKPEAERVKLVNSCS